MPGYSLTTLHQGREVRHEAAAMPSFIDGWIDGLRDGVAEPAVSQRPEACRRRSQRSMHCSIRMRTTTPCVAGATQRGNRGGDARWRCRCRRGDTRVSRGRRWHDCERSDRTSLLPLARTDEQRGLCHIPGGDEAYAGAAASVDVDRSRSRSRASDRPAAARRCWTMSTRASEGGDRDRRIRRSSVNSCERIRRCVTRRPTRSSPMPWRRWSAPKPKLPIGSLVRLRSPHTSLPSTSGPMAFYTAPSPDGNRGGTFFYNTADRILVDPGINSRSLRFTKRFRAIICSWPWRRSYDLHPVVGELEVTSYGEGWGLYSERLADEMGLYSSPLQRIGMLTLDSLRAARPGRRHRHPCDGLDARPGHRFHAGSHRIGAGERRG